MTKMKTTLHDNQTPAAVQALADRSPTINCFIGDLELRLYPIAGSWRVSIRVEPADPQFDDFATLEAAAKFFKNAVAEAVADF